MGKKRHGECREQEKGSSGWEYPNSLHLPKWNFSMMCWGVRQWEYEQELYLYTYGSKDMRYISFFSEPTLACLYKYKIKIQTFTIWYIIIILCYVQHKPSPQLVNSNVHLDVMFHNTFSNILLLRLNMCLSNV